jgi:putative phage-type endonuclease
MIDPKLVEQGSDEWKVLRLGHVTASNIADVMAKGKSGEALTRKKYKTKLLAERLTGQSQDSYSNAAMEWGVEQEPFARMAYEVATNSLVDKTGFWHHPSIQWVGVSPDGLVDNDGLVEIKCPNTTTHLDYIMDDKVPTDYYKQIQCQLWVTGRTWCDFISYDPRLPQKNQLFIKRCMRDDNSVAEMETEVLAFLAEIEELIKYLQGDE